MDSHQERLNQIKQKYGAKVSNNEHRIRASSHYMPTSAYLPSENIKKKIIDQRESFIPLDRHNRRQSALSVHSKSYCNDLTISPRDISIAKTNKNRQIEKIREQYAASRKKVIADYTRQTNESTFKYDQRPQIYDKYDKYDIKTSSNLFNKLQISSKIVENPYRGKDYISDVYKKITQKGYQQNPQYETNYSNALEKAYEFSKNLIPENKYQFSLRADLSSMTKHYPAHREFGKQYNLDEHRISFGKIDSPQKALKKYEHLDKYYEISSPIKKVQNVFDIQSRFQSRKSQSPTKHNRLSYLPKENQENIAGSFSSKFKAQSSSQFGRWELGNIDRMQTKIQSLLDEKKFRY